jgi:hypothetical protein
MTPSEARTRNGRRNSTAAAKTSLTGIVDAADGVKIVFGVWCMSECDAYTEQATGTVMVELPGPVYDVQSIFSCSRSVL